METGALNVKQNFGVSAYQERVAMEVLTCVNNLQSRCDMLVDTNAILGSVTCYPGIEISTQGLLLANRLHENYLYSDVLGNAVGGHPLIGQLHSLPIYSNNPFSTTDIFNQQMSSDAYAKRLRKRRAGSTEEETARKKGKTNHMESSSHPSGTFLTGGISGEPARDKQKFKATKPRKGKDSSTAVKVEDKKPLSKASELKVRETDAETSALEWQRCVSLLKEHGVIENPRIVNKETVDHHVPHPGFVGDGLLTKMCKICRTAEDANNTVICDECHEVFHLSCCVPRLTPKYFKREDSWLCVFCKKQRRKMGSKLAGKESSQEDKSSKGTADNKSKARLGPEYQVDVPEWQERAADDLERCIEGSIGMEVSLTEEQKDAERDRILKGYDANIELLGWLPAEKMPSDTMQNWVKCNNVITKAYNDSNGRRQNEIVCGKWRRAPLNAEQTDEWECFCAIEWDPRHADCAIPQECSDEEVLKRMAYQKQTNAVTPASEAGGRKATLRQGKPAL